MALPRAVDVAVIGAGVFGLASALRLARAGLRVRLLDTAREGAPNASTVAAGMLAPVGETLAEGAGPAHLNRLMTARDLWPDFAASIPGISLERSGVEFREPSAAAERVLRERLLALAVQTQPLHTPAFGVAVADDWRLDAPVALAAMRETLRKLGVSVEAVTAAVSSNGELLANGESLNGARVVVAAGYGAWSLAAAAPELAALSPIKGQLVAFPPGEHEGALLRSPNVYFAPQPSGSRVGATMELGVANTDIDVTVIEAMHAAALRLAPELSGSAYRGEAGVRASTPDGWPLVGPSVTPGVLLAVGARRNGWLLAPLVSQMILDAVTGAPAHPLADAFHPGRFTR